MENQTNNQFKPIAVFLSITFALSSIFYFLIIDAGTLSAENGLYVLGLMWCPGIAGIITMLIFKRKMKQLGWKWGKTKYQIRSYVLPIIYALIAYVIIWTCGFGKINIDAFLTQVPDIFGFEGINSIPVFAISIMIVGTIGIIPGAISALGEEIGWRGFLVPELFKHQGFTKTSLISGFIWSIWHLPILLFADYNSGTPAWYSMTCFMLLVISASFIYTWFRIKSGSLWTAVILHASHNLFIQNIFTPLTENTGNTAYYIDEFGIVLPIISVGFALYFWSKRKELQPVSNKA
jgi:membrane protease YdiL (CAAX protease family)